MEMSAIQSSHRRIILVHCDSSITKRIMDVAVRLELLKGDKIWIILDGVIGKEMLSPQFWSYLSLPIGMLGLRQRAPALTEADTIYSIISMIGDAAANVLINTKAWISQTDLGNGSSPQVNCWYNSTVARIKYSQVVYR